MTIETLIDQSKDLTIATGTGELSFHDISHAIQSFYEGTPTSNVLWDLREAMVSDISTEHISQIANNLRSFREKGREGKTAIVSSMDVTFGMARMFQLLTESLGESRIEMRVFRDLDEALQWLEQGK